MHIVKKYIKGFLCSFFIGMMCVLAACSKPDAYDVFDQPIYLKEMQGKWILLNYWADWCKPCYREIPTFNHMSQAYKNDLVILGINFDQLPQNKLRQFAIKNQLQYSILTKDLGAVFGIRNISTLPATFVISPEGHIVKELYGEQAEEDLLKIMQLDT